MSILSSARERLEAFVLGSPNDVLPDVLTGAEAERLSKLRRLEDDVIEAVRIERGLPF